MNSRQVLGLKRVSILISETGTEHEPIRSFVHKRGLSAARSPLVEFLQEYSVANDQPSSKPESNLKFEPTILHHSSPTIINRKMQAKNTNAHGRNYKLTASDNRSGAPKNDTTARNKKSPGK